MSASPITPNDVAEWCRSQIRKYQLMLAQIENDFPMVVRNNDTKNWINPPQLPKLGTVNADQIKDYISKRGARAGDLAAHFNVDESAIHKIIDDPANGLTDKDRGWVKLVSPGQQVFNAPLSQS